MADAGGRFSLRPFDPLKDKPRANPDGSFSTEITRTVQTPAGWANVPSLWWGESGAADLGHLNDDQLAKLSSVYERETGQRFPRFQSIEEAETVARQRSAAGGATQGPLAARQDQPGNASGGGGWSTHKRSTFADRWEKSTSKAILQGILDAVTLPGDVYRGEVDPRSDEAIGRAFDLAGTLTLGAGAVPAGANELRMGIRAYHGSPHNYAAERLVKRPDGSTEYLVGQPDQLPDVPEGYEVIKDFPLGRQRMDKIGTGEGNQAYGHGLYNAEAEGVARGYRDSLSRSMYQLASGETQKGSAVYDQLMSVADQVKGDDLGRALHPDHRRAAVRQILEGVDEFGSIDKYMEEYGYPYQFQGLHEAVTAKAKELDMRPFKGHMYETEIAANPEDFLDWDKPLSEQPPHVQQKAKGALGVLEPTSVEQLESGRWVTMRDGEVLGRPDGWPTKGDADYAAKILTKDAQRTSGKTMGELMHGPSHAIREDRSKKLAQAGIPGIRYLDQGSRVDPNEVKTWQQAVAQYEAQGDSAKLATAKRALADIERRYAEGTRNYVVFDDSLISILKKYGVVGPVLAALGLSQALPDRAEASEQQGGGW